jgi:hypothetical protein
MNWIARPTGELLDLADQRRLARLLALVAERLADGHSIAGIGDFVGVLSAIDDNHRLRAELSSLVQAQAVDVVQHPQQMVGVG